MPTKEEIVNAARNMLALEIAIRDHKCRVEFCCFPGVGPVCEEAQKLDKSFKEARATLVKLLEGEG